MLFMDMKADEQTDRQTDRHAHKHADDNTFRSYEEVK